MAQQQGTSSFTTTSTAMAGSSTAGGGVNKVVFGKYEVGRLLGCGAFAKVYHARHAASGQAVALKVLSKPRLLRLGLAGHLRREIAAMRRLRHPHVLRLLEVVASRSRVVLVLELARGGELFSRLRERGRMPEEAARGVFRQLVSAVAYAHSRGVFHRDLKPENLLLDDAGSLKVSDFGLSALAPPPPCHHPFVSRTLCGTPAYVAPEMLSKRPYDAAKVDLWSCGVILFVLAAGYLPFNDPNLMALYRKICRGDVRFPRGSSSGLRRLVSRLLDVNPTTRIDVAGVAADPWFRSGLEPDQADSLLRFRPEIETRIVRFEQKMDHVSRDLNAFDLIAFAPGTDLSGLLEPDQMVNRVWVVLTGSVGAVLGTVEEVASREGLVVRARRAKEGACGVAAVEGHTGGLVVWIEVYRVNQDLVVVEAEMGDEEEQDTFWRDRLGPALLGVSGLVSCDDGVEPDPTGSGEPDRDDSLMCSDDT